MQHLIRIAFIAVAIGTISPASLATATNKPALSPPEPKSVHDNAVPVAQPLPSALPLAPSAAPYSASGSIQPPPPTQPSMWPVIVGGLLAMMGGGLAQFVSHAYSARREHDKLLREKAEELCKALFALSNWLHDGARAITSGAEHADPSPLERVQTIQSLYFPELAAPFSGVADAAVLVIQTTSREHQLVLEADRNQKVAEIKFEANRKNGANADPAELLNAIETAGNTRVRAIQRAAASFAPFHEAMSRATESVVQATQKRTAGPAWKAS